VLYRICRNRYVAVTLVETKYVVWAYYDAIPDGHFQTLGQQNIFGPESLRSINGLQTVLSMQTNTSQ